VDRAGASLAVTATAPPSLDPPSALGTTPDGPSALDARAEVTLTATLTTSQGPWRCVCAAEAESPYGPGAASAGEASRRARRLAAEDAARCLAESLRDALEGRQDPDGNCRRE
jgi:hypothetical protein